jgi:hypothetical protein
MPLFSLLLLRLCVGNSGFPLTINFVGELLSLYGAFERLPLLGVLAYSSIKGFSFPFPPPTTTHVWWWGGGDKLHHTCVVVGGGGRHGVLVPPPLPEEINSACGAGAAPFLF